MAPEVAFVRFLMVFLPALDGLNDDFYPTIVGATLLGLHCRTRADSPPFPPPASGSPQRLATRGNVGHGPGIVITTPRGSSHSSYLPKLLLGQFEVEVRARGLCGFPSLALRGWLPPTRPLGQIGNRIARAARKSGHTDLPAHRRPIDDRFHDVSSVVPQGESHRLACEVPETSRFIASPVPPQVHGRYSPQSCL
jgi:hypothetical protein